ncbi:MAG TPA: hypothetical protein VH478_04540 [Trebonia sp.]|nr:hypothetical protein [Trebonia sp.]
MLTVGTLVVVNSQLGEITKLNTRLGRATGHNVRVNLDGGDPTLGFLPHFCPDYLVAEARVGVNICPRPKGTCFCGLVHLRQDWLDKVRQQQDRAQGDIPADPAGSRPTGWREHAAERAQQAAWEREARDDDIVRRAAQLDPADQSRGARHLRETAGSILDHREDAAQRAVRAAADNLGVAAAPPPPAGELANAGIGIIEYLQAQATLLRSLRQRADHGQLTAEQAASEARRYRDPEAMFAAARNATAPGEASAGGATQPPAQPGPPRGDGAAHEAAQGQPGAELAGDSPYNGALAALDAYARTAASTATAAEALEARLTVHGFDRDEAVMAHVGALREAATVLQEHARSARTGLTQRHAAGAEYHASGRDAGTTAFRQPG